MTRSDFAAMVRAARDAAAAYYDGGDILMTDAEYDALLDTIGELAREHPDWDTEGVLDEVAAGVSRGGTVAHPTPMLSLGKAKDPEAVAVFVALVSTPVLVEPKLDGLAVRAEYRGGRLVLVATRGDGASGEDVTAQARGVQGLPEVLPEAVDCEVRGEVYMTDADFDVASANRVAAGKPAFVNPRNATAGCLRNADADYEAPMSFAAYEITGPVADGALTHVERSAVMARLGIASCASLLPELSTPTEAASEVLARLDAIGARRTGLGYPIDGAVVKVDSIAARDRLGAIARTPRWAVAYKYAPDTATTVLRDIEVAVGRTGRISLRAALDPVFVGGATITYATLHNPKFVTDADFRIGDTVYVYRAGDVIPRVNAVEMSRRPAGAEPWQPPSTCPACGETWETSSLLWRCHTPACSTVGRIEYACSRDALDVEGLSEAIAEAIVEAGLARDIADLFTLTADDLANLPLGDGARIIGAKVAAKIITEINKAKNQPLSRVLIALGIRGTGRTMSRRLAAHFGSLSAFRSASIDELTEVEGIGPEKASLIHSELVLLSDVIDRMVAAGITAAHDAPPASAGATGPLAGKKVCVTGTVPGLSRNEANEAVERLGGKSSSSVSKATHLVVIGDGAGSKAEKAAALGIPVMAAEDFMALIAAQVG